jgi:hypothetical protein
LGGLGGHGDDRDVDAVAAGDLAQLANVENRHPAARLVADFLIGDVEQREISNPSRRNPGIVGEREPQVAGADDGDVQLAIEAENLAQMRFRSLT